MENHMPTPHDLLQAIVDEDFVAAKEITNSLVFAAVSNELEAAKIEVADKLFDVCEGCGCDEAKMSSTDSDSDGKLENIPREVHGARINAGIRAGNISPKRAARMKGFG